MNQERTVITAAAVAGAVAIGGWVALPYLQSPAAAVHRESSVHVERARRLLHEYNPALAYGALMGEQLKAAEVDVAQSVDDIADNSAEEYQAAHEALWAAYEPRNWKSDRPTPDRANYNNPSGQIRDGLAEREQVTSANTRLLDEAMREADTALAVSSGDASGRTDVEANQLKGVILYQKGLAERMKADALRQHAERRRREILELAEAAAKNASNLTLIADSKIDDTIAVVEKQIAESESRLSEKRGELQKLEDRVADLQTQVADAGKRAGDASDRLEQLKADGLNFADPDGAQAFEQKVNELNKEYTQAMRQAHLLEFGGYPKAEIDHSGDYVRGRYVEGGTAGDLTVDVGLRHFTTQRDVMAAKVNKENEALANLRTDLQTLQQTRSEYEQAEAAAKAQIAELSPQATEAYEDLNRIASEAGAIEEKALDYLDKAAKQFEQTARLAEQWSREGSDRISNLASEVRDFSADEHRGKNRWLAGYSMAQAADARLEKAWIYYTQYKASLRDAEVLENATRSLELAEVDLPGERTKAAEAKKAGVDEVTLAMASLQKAHRDVGNHWSVTAQGAGTTYLLALFGETDYAKDALEAYRSALKGRENDPHLAKFAQRAKELEAAQSR